MAFEFNLAGKLKTSCKKQYTVLLGTVWQQRDRRQISILTLSEIKRINLLPFPLKSWENLLFPENFRGEWMNQLA